MTMDTVSSKDIPWLELTYENILYYINGLMCADGGRILTDNPTKEFKSIQVTGELNKYIYDLLNIAGYYVTSTNDLTETETNYGKRSSTTIKYGVKKADFGIYLMVERFNTVDITLDIIKKQSRL